MANSDKALTSLHRCANDGINPPSVVHKTEKHYNFAQEGANAAFLAGHPVEGWIGRVKFLFFQDGTAKMIAYDLGNGEVAFSKYQQDRLLFGALAVHCIGKGIR